MRFDLLSSLFASDNDITEFSQTSQKGKIEINGATVNMFEQKMLSRLLCEVIPHDGVILRKAMLYVLGIDANEVKVITMSASMSEDGQWRMDKKTKCIPLTSEGSIKDLLLQ